MRRRFALIAVLALGIAGLVCAQQNPSPGRGKGPLGAIFAPREHARPVPASTVRVPVVAVDASNLGSPLVLDKDWRVGVTANPEAAKPDFDDTKWQVRNAQETIADVPDQDHPEDATEKGWEEAGNKGPGHQRPFVWFRMHLKLAPNHGPVALLIELPVTQNTNMAIGSTGPGIDVFANGRQVRPDGPHGDQIYNYEEISRIYRLDLDSGQTDLTLVVRTLFIPVGYYAYTSFFSKRTFTVGNPDDLRRSWDLWFLHILFERLPRLVNSILLTFLAIFLLALYFTQKGHAEYLWLALHEIVQAPIGFIDLEGSLARIDQLWYAAVTLQLVAISAYLYFEFVVAFLSIKRKWTVSLLRWTAPILIGVGPTLLLLGDHGVLVVMTLVVVYLGSLLWIIGWSLFLFVTLIAATIRRNFEAGLLLIPLVLTIIGIAEPIMTSLISDSSGHTYRSPLTIYAGPIPIHFASIADFTGLLAIVLIIFVRFLRIQHDRERAQSELHAARSVQELMIPREKQETPGYEVDSVYQPATEVGGDFFHVQPGSDGSLLVVIGDVAGHGLKAAMNVSMLMGALRRIPEKSPSKILESLNRVLLDSESLTTCQALWFGPDGELVLSSAGHLFPYLNSQEITLPGGLPLGAVPDVHYEERRLYLHPGDRLLLLSDGVVEARSGTGELFGFDRVHNLSNQSAFYIADAAKGFGQEDDITVLTVRRLAQAIAA
ncbi:MAG TPA: PP2C family protein-serine/threonine phosphatase [Terracidiphilus sp.]|nr:PP2C family protein-serine/threonine phosphatase [Terracidiphilus sp.]